MKWSHKDEEYLKTHYIDTSVTYEAMIAHLGKSKKSICHKASRMGVSRGRKPANKSKRPRTEYDNEYYRLNKQKIMDARRDRRRALKRHLVMIMGGCCSKCQYKRSLSALDFHHKGEDKEGELSRLIHSEQKKMAIRESKKCIILCANCHRELHEKFR